MKITGVSKTRGRGRGRGPLFFCFVFGFMFWLGQENRKRNKRTMDPDPDPDPDPAFYWHPKITLRKIYKVTKLRISERGVNTDNDKQDAGLTLSNGFFGLNLKIFVNKVCNGEAFEFFRCFWKCKFLSEDTCSRTRAEMWRVVSPT